MNLMQHLFNSSSPYDLEREKSYKDLGHIYFDKRLVHAPGLLKQCRGFIICLSMKMNPKRPKTEVIQSGKKFKWNIKGEKQHLNFWENLKMTIKLK